MKKTTIEAPWMKDMKARKTRGVIGAIFYLIIIVICVLVLVKIYSNAIQHKCPFCSGRIEYVDKIYKNHSTKFRHQCVENPLHYIDLDIKID